MVVSKQEPVLFMSSLERLMSTLREPEFAYALVTWDRDVAPLLSHHGVCLGDRYSTLHGPGPWASLAQSIEHPPCCHFRFVPDVGWMRVTDSPWHGYRANCPLTEVP